MKGSGFFCKMLKSKFESLISALALDAIVWPGLSASALKNMNIIGHLYCSIIRKGCFGKIVCSPEHTQREGGVCHDDHCTVQHADLWGMQVELHQYQKLR